MKFVILNIGLLLSFNSLAAVKGGDEVRNGGGVAEQYVAYALRTLPRSIDLCLRVATCAKESEQKKLLKKIKDSLPLELQADILRFTSNILRPGFFTINGIERLAVTADYVGAPIYYNTSMLYSYDDVRITVGGAIQSLIHELGHHQGVIDHDSLEVLGSEVRKTVEKLLMEVPYQFQSIGKIAKKLEMKAISIEGQSFKDHDNGSLEVIFKNEMINLNASFNELNSKCDIYPGKPIVSSSFQFFNLHWDYKVDEQTTGDKYLSGNVMLYCRDQFSRVHKKNFSFTFKIKTTFDKVLNYQSHELVDGPAYLYTEDVPLFRKVERL